MIRWLTQLLCCHEYTRLTDWLEGRHYMQCIKCLKTTPGFYFATSVFKSIKEK